MMMTAMIAVGDRSWKMTVAHRSATSKVGGGQEKKTIFVATLCVFPFFRIIYFMSLSFFLLLLPHDLRYTWFKWKSISFTPSVLACKWMVQRQDYVFESPNISYFQKFFLIEGGGNPFWVDSYPSKLILLREETKSVKENKGRILLLLWVSQFVHFREKAFARLLRVLSTRSCSFTIPCLPLHP